MLASKFVFGFSEKSKAKSWFGHYEINGNGKDQRDYSVTTLFSNGSKNRTFWIQSYLQLFGFPEKQIFIYVWSDHCFC